MAFIPFVRGASVEVVCRLAGEVVENRLHFRAATDPGPVQLTDLANAVFDWYQTNILPNISSSVTIQQVIARGLTAQQDAVAEATLVPPLSGSLNANACPSQVAYSVGFRTGYSGRSAKGRISFFGMLASDVVSNVLAGARVAAFRGAVGAMIGPDALLNGWTFGVASYRTGGQPRAAAQFLAATSLGVSRNTVGSQNSRKAGVGE